MRYEAIAVYLMANKKHGTLYTGVTSSLIKRCWEHKSGVVEGFTSKYELHKLVYYELHETMELAIHREKRIKKYTRVQKIALIESMNPAWEDLYDNIV